MFEREIERGRKRDVQTYPLSLLQQIERDRKSVRVCERERGRERQTDRKEIERESETDRQRRERQTDRQTDPLSLLQRPLGDEADRPVSHLLVKEQQVGRCQVVVLPLSKHRQRHSDVTSMPHRRNVVNTHTHTTTSTSYLAALAFFAQTWYTGQNLCRRSRVFYPNLKHKMFSSVVSKVLGLTFWATNVFGVYLHPLHCVCFKTFCRQVTSQKNF